jgi:hypothetical protein
VIEDRRQAGTWKVSSRHEIAMTSARQLRRIALSLPEATEQDHHGRPSYRVGGKIFATLWDPEHVNVMLDLHQIRIAVNEHRRACREFWWGKQIRAVQLTLPLADARVVRELLTEAWRLKAPRALATGNQPGT